MEAHLSQEDLIRLQFGLLEGYGVDPLQAHLHGCAQCRQQLLRLQAKYAQLDLLKDQAALSEGLVRSVLETRKARARSPRPRRLALWRLSIAASVMLGAVSFWWAGAHLSGPGRGAAGPQPEGLRAVDSARLEREPEQPLRSQAGMPPKGKRSAGISPEPPPFAPASAIELVVLPKRQKVQITVYNKADLTLVREERRLMLKRGWNWLQFMWANTAIDPTSLHLEPQAEADKIRIEQLVYPAGLKDIGRWLIHSEVEGHVPFEMSYFVSGVRWRAFYMGTLAQDEKTLSLQGYVHVENRSGEDFQDVQTRLVVGELHLLDEILALSQRTHPYGRPRQAAMGARSAGMGGMDGFGDRLGEVRELLREDLNLNVAAAALRPKTIAKQGLSEYFLYTIPGTETIPHEWSKRLLSFSVEDVNTVSLYRYEESRYGGQPMRFIRFANDEAHHLGRTPIPAGEVKLYQAQADGRLAFVGSTGIKYVPVNDEVEFNLGPARLVSVKPQLMDLETMNYRFDQDRNVAGWDERRSWRIDIDNARSGPVDCEILRDFGTAYWSIQVPDADLLHEKHDATRARFRLSIPGQAKRSLHYTVTTFHGTRTQETDTPIPTALTQRRVFNRMPPTP